MNFLRSSLFLLCAFLITAVVATIVAILALARIKPLAWALAAVWQWLMMQAVRWVLGIRTVVLGAENMPKEPVVVLSKHQSAWETVALQSMVPGHPIFVLKKSLLHLPFLGWALGAIGMIAIDRTSGRDALDRVAAQGRQRLAEGCSVIIFPEGTRVAPGEKKRFQPGGAVLAARCGAKVVPIAHNAGECWPRNAFVKKPGVVTVSIGEPIDTAGISERELNKRIESWIDAEMRRISPHLYPDAGQA